MPDEQNPESSITNPVTPSSEPRAGDAELATARAELEQVRATVAQIEQERQAAEAAAQQRFAQLETRNTELSAATLDAHRRAVLAENVGQVVPELVQGATTEEIDASVETARAAYGRIAESVRASAQAELSVNSLPAVPTGASPRGEPPAEDLSPLQKITSALSRNGR
jgi:multidrug resistance efflux pump